jgi:hypothetical protein
VSRSPNRAKSTMQDLTVTTVDTARLCKDHSLCNHIDRVTSFYINFGRNAVPLPDRCSSTVHTGQSSSSGATHVPVAVKCHTGLRLLGLLPCCALQLGFKGLARTAASSKQPQEQHCSITLLMLGHCCLQMLRRLLLRVQTYSSSSSSSTA